MVFKGSKTSHFLSLMTCWGRFLNQKIISLQPQKKKLRPFFSLQMSKNYMKECEFLMSYFIFETEFGNRAQFLDGKCMRLISSKAWFQNVYIFQFPSRSNFSSENPLNRHVQKCHALYWCFVLWRDKYWEEGWNSTVEHGRKIMKFKLLLKHFRKETQ